jgi:hypothetical protein
MNRFVALVPAGIVKMSPAAIFKVLPFLFMGTWGFEKAFALRFGMDPKSLSSNERIF